MQPTKSKQREKSNFDMGFVCDVLYVMYDVRYIVYKIGLLI